MTDLLSVSEALSHIMTGIQPLAAEPVSLEQALGRVLADEVRSDMDLPPFANSSMDGYAVIAHDVADASQDRPIMLKLVQDIPAGSTPQHHVASGEAARIMTGAPMPPGADAVVPVEQTASGFRAGDGSALPSSVHILRNVKTGDYVRPAGEDIRRGDLVLAAGTVLRPAELGVLAALGQAVVPVVRRPKVAILSTGDELVDIGDPLAPGKIRDTNAYTLAGLVSEYGGEPIRMGIARDTLDDVRRHFHDALAHQPDILISSAGVSVGTFDVVRSVLAELGEVSFWRVNLRPGKPLAFGRVQGVPFFGLPGNPVSAMVTFDVFVRPMLLRLSRRPDAWPTVKATVSEPIPSDGRRSYVRVKLSRTRQGWEATTTGTQSSGALTSMVHADGLLIIPEGLTQAQAGDEFEVRVLRPVNDLA